MKNNKKNLFGFILCISLIIALMFSVLGVASAKIDTTDFTTVYVEAEAVSINKAGNIFVGANKDLRFELPNYTYYLHETEFKSAYVADLEEYVENIVLVRLNKDVEGRDIFEVQYAVEETKTLYVVYAECPQPVYAHIYSFLNANEPEVDTERRIMTSLSAQFEFERMNYDMTPRYIDDPYFDSIEPDKHAEFFTDYRTYGNLSKFSIDEYKKMHMHSGRDGNSTNGYGFIIYNNYIIYIIDQELFLKTGSNFYMGQRYGYYIETRPVVNYCMIRGVDINVTDYMGAFESHVFMFEIVNTIEWEIGTIETKVNPLFQATYQTYVKKDGRWRTPSHGRGFASHLDIVTFNLTSDRKGNINITDVSFAIELSNETDKNISDPSYMAVRNPYAATTQEMEVLDKGAFITQTDYFYKGKARGDTVRGSSGGEVYVPVIKQVLSAIPKYGNIFTGFFTANEMLRITAQSYFKEVKELANEKSPLRTDYGISAEQQVKNNIDGNGIGERRTKPEDINKLIKNQVLRSDRHSSGTTPLLISTGYEDKNFNNGQYVSGNYKIGYKSDYLTRINTSVELTLVRDTSSTHWALFSGWIKNGSYYELASNRQSKTFTKIKGNNIAKDIVQNVVQTAYCQPNGATNQFRFEPDTTGNYEFELLNTLNKKFILVESELDGQVVANVSASKLRLNLIKDRTYKISVQYADESDSGRFEVIIRRYVDKETLSNLSNRLSVENNTTLKAEQTVLMRFRPSISGIYSFKISSVKNFECEITDGKGNMIARSSEGFVYLDRDNEYYLRLQNLTNNDNIANIRFSMGETAILGQRYNLSNGMNEFSFTPSESASYIITADGKITLIDSRGNFVSSNRDTLFATMYADESYVIWVEIEQATASFIIKINYDALHYNASLTENPNDIFVALEKFKTQTFTPIVSGDYIFKSNEFDVMINGQQGQAALDGFIFSLIAGETYIVETILKDSIINGYYGTLYIRLATESVEISAINTGQTNYSFIPEVSGNYNIYASDTFVLYDKYLNRLEMTGDARYLETGKEYKIVLANKADLFVIAPTDIFLGSVVLTNNNHVYYFVSADDEYVFKAAHNAGVNVEIRIYDSNFDLLDTAIVGSNYFSQIVKSLPSGAYFIEIICSGIVEFGVDVKYTAITFNDTVLISLLQEESKFFTFTPTISTYYKIDAIGISIFVDGDLYTQPLLLQAGTRYEIMAVNNQSAMANSSLMLTLDAKDVALNANFVEAERLYEISSVSSVLYQITANSGRVTLYDSNLNIVITSSADTLYYLFSNDVVYYIGFELACSSFILSASTTTAIIANESTAIVQDFYYSFTPKITGNYNVDLSLYEYELLDSNYNQIIGGFGGRLEANHTYFIKALSSTTIKISFDTTILAVSNGMVLTANSSLTNYSLTPARTENLRIIPTGGNAVIRIYDSSFNLQRTSSAGLPVDFIFERGNIYYIQITNATRIQAIRLNTNSIVEGASISGTSFSNEDSYFTFTPAVSGDYLLRGTGLSATFHTLFDGTFSSEVSISSLLANVVYYVKVEGTTNFSFQIVKPITSRELRSPTGLVANDGIFRLTNTTQQTINFELNYFPVRDYHTNTREFIYKIDTHYIFSTTGVVTLRNLTTIPQNYFVSFVAYIDGISVSFSFNVNIPVDNILLSTTSSNNTFARSNTGTVSQIIQPINRTDGIFNVTYIVESGGANLESLNAHTGVFKIASHAEPSSIRNYVTRVFAYLNGVKTTFFIDIRVADFVYEPTIDDNNFRINWVTSTSGFGNMRLLIADSGGTRHDVIYSILRSSYELSLITVSLTPRQLTLTYTATFNIGLDNQFIIQRTINIHSHFAGGNGTSADPWRIGNERHFKNLKTSNIGWLGSGAVHVNYTIPVVLLERNGGTGDRAVPRNIPTLNATISVPQRNGFKFLGYFSAATDDDDDDDAQQYCHANGNRTELSLADAPSMLFARWERDYQHLTIKPYQNRTGTSGLRKYYVEMTNPNPYPVKIAYNSKLAHDSDAKNWTNLKDIEYIAQLASGATSRVIIQENWTATSITVRIEGENGKKYVTYSNNLTSSTFGNIRYHTF
ncbi:MAG: hypothetical protein FWH03_00915 [Firmicutes bacterium]|nr:hypothetical protein [Bacillota bacterium]